MFRFLAAVISLAAAASAQVGEPVRTGHATSRLIAETTAAVPGETVWVALAQELDEGWHVYWKNPGDSGLPLVLDWTLPRGFEAGEIGYPLPHRLPLGPLTNFGHEGSPTFLVPISVPVDAVPGTTAQLSVFAEWLICLDVCIPEAAQLSLSLPVAREAQPSAQAARIRAARSARPRDSGLSARFGDRSDTVVLAVEDAPAGEAYFFPDRQGVTEPTPPQRALRAGGTLFLELTPGVDYLANPPETLSGVLSLRSGGEEIGVVISAERDADITVPGAFPGTAPATGGDGETPGEPSGRVPGNLLILFALALAGGLVLNAMPCVFPIVFLKASGIASLAGADRSAVRTDAVAYTVGVVATFAAMAALLLLLRAGGAQLGWGFHLQSPTAVGVFAIVVFLIGLNLAGVFEVGASVQNIGTGLAGKKGPAGSFFTGLLAVVVAAPCIGPFLGVPMGYALTAPPLLAMAVFVVLGLGLALPYLVLAAVPWLAGLLPRPGGWMGILKQLFSFAMFGTVVWLAWVVSLQAGPQGVLVLGIGFVLAALAGWLFGLAQRQGAARRLRAAALAALVAAVAPLIGLSSAAPPQDVTSADIATETYDEARLAELRAEGTPVFIDFTAAWCVTCQYNKRVVLDTPEVREIFAETGTVMMVADLTNPDPVITAAIERQGRSGVPLYLYYNGRNEPEILPQILTTERVRTTLETTG